MYVEDVYETRVGPNDANLSMLDMMKGIEEKYRYELLLLDKVSLIHYVGHIQSPTNNNNSSH